MMFSMLEAMGLSFLNYGYVRNSNLEKLKYCQTRASRHPLVRLGKIRLLKVRSWKGRKKDRLRESHTTDVSSCDSKA
jgi:hypothetical protein